MTGGAALRVVIANGAAGDRQYDVVRALLDKGYVVARVQEVPAPSDEDVVLGSEQLPQAEPATVVSALDRLRSGRGLPEGGGWKPWFPVIDYTRCTNCMQCLSFCLFEVYGVSADRKIQVQNQNNCKTECPACSRVCPEVAIMFPKYRHGPINGEPVNEDDIRREAMKVDISALLGGDVYAVLRDRSARATSRFSKERDDERALKERQNCLVALRQALDVPADVLAALPGPDEIRAKAEAAAARAAEARGES
jgi:Pyruvate/2-oxoacid:ferredoxin oxidoreductase delta subunit